MTSVSLKKRTRVFLAVCSLFKIPARTWHGIFRSDWSQRNKISLTRFLSRFYELPLSGLGLCEGLLPFGATVKMYLSPLPKWALNQFKPKFSWMFLSHCGSKMLFFIWAKSHLLALKGQLLECLSAKCQVEVTKKSGSMFPRKEGLCHWMVE